MHTTIAISTHITAMLTIRTTIMAIMAIRIMVIINRLSRAGRSTITMKIIQVTPVITRE